MKVDEPFCLLDPMGSDDFDSASKKKFKIDPLPSTERLAFIAAPKHICLPLSFPYRVDRSKRDERKLVIELSHDARVFTSNEFTHRSLAGFEGIRVVLPFSVIKDRVILLVGRNLVLMGLTVAFGEIRSRLIRSQENYKTDFSSARIAHCRRWLLLNDP